MLKFWIAGYVLLLASFVVGLCVLRANVLAAMGTSAAEADWNRWRAEAESQNGAAGPVQRSVPKSNVPPLLLLMRDYFPAALVGLVLPVSALYWFIAWLICGVTRQSSPHSPSAPRGSP